MNTKSSEISSELVAVAWMNPDEDMSDEAFSWATDTSTGHVLAVVRLSDAEAIINDLQTLVIAENQRKQQLEEDRDTWKERAEFSYAQRDKQSAALKLARAGLITYGCSTDIETCDCEGCKALAAIDALEGE